MKNIFQFLLIFSLALFLASFFTSCDEEDLEAEELATIQEYADANGFTEANLLDEGFYLKFYNDTAANTNNTKPEDGQTVVLSFTGKYLDNSVFETTERAIGEVEFPSRYLVYGPYRIVAGTLIYGVDTAIKYMSVGDSASILIPSWYAWYNNTPLVYDIKLYEIIDDLEEKDSLEYIDYLANNDYSYNVDTIYSNSIHYKVIKDSVGNFPNTINSSMSTTDTFVLCLTGRYAETDSYISNTKGRVFFPCGTVSDTVKRLYTDDYDFPFIEAIDSTLKRMAIGDIIEIACKSDIAYSDDGFYDPVYNVAIVPPYMSVNYRIELVEIISGDTDDDD